MGENDTIENFTIEFFKNLKCSTEKQGEIYIISNVPRSFEDLVGKSSPFRISFSKVSGAEHITRGSSFFNAMAKYLDSAGKTTLLKIDFDVDPMKEISKVISLKNCQINNVSKEDNNNYFSRFTFMTSFRYLNESEQVINELYVHNGEIVDGDLEGYRVIEGEGNEASSKHLERDYSVAKNSLKELLNDKTQQIGESLGDKLEKEITRIRNHYENLLGELGGDLNSQLEKIKEVELQLRVAEEEDVENLRSRLNKLRKGLLKIGDDDSKNKILKEQELTINDAMHKHSLSIDNKLINTTIIYYPVYSLNLFLKNDNSGRQISLKYNPLTRELDQISCESCGIAIKALNLCSAGHVCCENCLSRCAECGEQYCNNCLKRSCNSCGKPLCKNCAVMCLGCGKHVCKTHMRVDGVTGEDRCVRCLRACFRCHGMAQDKYFGEAVDGSKVCQKCLGEEKRDKVMKDIFRD